MEKTEYFNILREETKFFQYRMPYMFIIVSCICYDQETLILVQPVN